MPQFYSEKKTEGMVANINIRSRFTQVIILIITIVACLLFSQVALAQRAQKTIRYDDPKFKIKLHCSANKVCYILWKKRTCSPKPPVFASVRRVRVKPMAETGSSY